MKPERPRIDPPLEEYVVEWGVEDPDRYARLTGRRTQPSKQQYDRKAKVEPTMVLVAVLEVPLPKAEQVTNAVRSSPRVASDGRSYVAQAAAHADSAAALTDDHARLQMQVDALADQVMHYARRCDAYDEAQRIMLHHDDQLVFPMLSDNPNSKLYRKKAQLTVDQIKSQSETTDYVGQLRSAISEKKLDVAVAKLVALSEEDEEDE